MREAFAAGYAEAGPLPVPGWVRAACEAAISTPGATTHLVEAAGRVEGRRAALQRRRQKLYDTHRGQVMACAQTLAENVHLDDLLRACRTTTEASNDQRTAVKAAAAAVLTLTLRHSDGLQSRWQQANADAVVESRAEGHAEAGASTVGPPDPKRVAAIFPAAAAGLATAAAWKTADEWTTAQIGGLAGDVADAFKPYLTDDAAAAALRGALAARAGVAYYLEELMHAGYAFGFHITAQAAGVPGLNFMTCEDDRVCATCDAYEGANPWTPDAIPVPPVHGGCRCSYEYAGQTLQQVA